MQIFKTYKLTLITFLIMLIISPITSHSDISKAFPDMSNVFEKVSFYDENNEFTKFSGHENKVLLVFLDIRTVQMFALLQYWIWQE